MILALLIVLLGLAALSMLILLLGVVLLGAIYLLERRTTTWREFEEAHDWEPQL